MPIKSRIMNNRNRNLNKSSRVRNNYRRINLKSSASKRLRTKNNNRRSKHRQFGGMFGNLFKKGKKATAAKVAKAKAAKVAKAAAAAPAPAEREAKSGVKLKKVVGTQTAKQKPFTYFF
jgi:hypothetical protein